MCEPASASMIPIFAVKKELLLKNLCVEADGNHEHKHCETSITFDSSYNEPCIEFRAYPLQGGALHAISGLAKNIFPMRTRIRTSASRDHLLSATVS
jgi:hypothetical protein